jgi:4-hydroxybenzoate polyprenyltransferase
MFYGDFCVYLEMIGIHILVDTIYAVQDLADDAKMGVGSSALAFASNIYLFLYIFATAFVVSFIALGLLNGQGPIFFAISVGYTFLDLFSQVKVLDVQDPSSYAGQSDCWEINPHL